MGAVLSLLLLHGLFLPLPRCGVRLMECCPSQTDPLQAFHRLQILKHRSNTAPYHRAHPLGGTPAWLPMGSSSPSPPAPPQAPLHRLQPEPGAAPTEALCGLCLLQASSTTQRSPPRLHAEICSMGYPRPAGDFCTDLGACRAFSLTLSHSSPICCCTVFFSL